MNTYRIVDITTGRTKGEVQANTEQGAVRKGNKMFGWSQWHKAFIV